MFCPSGPSVEVSSSNSNPSNTLTLSGINRNNPVLLVNVNPEGRAELAFYGTGFSVSLSLFSGFHLVRIPVEATSVTVTASHTGAGTSVSGIASICVGEEV